MNERIGANECLVTMTGFWLFLHVTLSLKFACISYPSSRGNLYLVTVKRLVACYANGICHLLPGEELLLIIQTKFVIRNSSLCSPNQTCQLLRGEDLLLVLPRKSVTCNCEEESWGYLLLVEVQKRVTYYLNFF